MAGDSIKIYRAKTGRWGGTSFDELIKKARRLFKEIESNPRRKLHIRSAYFKKEKIFFDYFWPHLNQEPPRQRQKRLAYLECGIELLQNSRH